MSGEKKGALARGPSERGEGNFPERTPPSGARKVNARRKKGKKPFCNSLGKSPARRKGEGKHLRETCEKIFTEKSALSPRKIE